jgi:addiction module HigA family antidote
LNAAKLPNDMNLPGWRWHALKGSMAGRCSVSVNGNWRITYAFENGDAILVDYEDYHWGEMGMSAMYDPPHPGEILSDTVLRADGGITVTAFAEKLKMTRAAISRVVNGKAGISPELSLRLEEALGTSAESWLAMQSAYDLSQAKKTHRVKVKRIHIEDAEIA